MRSRRWGSVRFLIPGKELSNRIFIEAYFADRPILAAEKPELPQDRSSPPLVSEHRVNHPEHPAAVHIASNYRIWANIGFFPAFALLDGNSGHW